MHTMKSCAIVSVSPEEARKVAKALLGDGYGRLMADIRIAADHIAKVNETDPVDACFRLAESSKVDLRTTIEMMALAAEMLNPSPAYIEACR